MPDKKNDSQECDRNYINPVHKQLTPRHIKQVSKYNDLQDNQHPVATHKTDQQLQNVHITPELDHYKYCMNDEVFGSVIHGSDLSRLQLYQPSHTQPQQPTCGFLPPIKYLIESLESDLKRSRQQFEGSYHSHHELTPKRSKFMQDIFYYKQQEKDGNGQYRNFYYK